MSNAMHSFRDILTSKGLLPPDIIADGKLHRCPTEAKPHKQNGAYIAHLDAPATLWWCNWESAEQDTFTEAEEKSLSPAEREVLKQRHTAMKRQREAEFAERQTAAAQKAQSELNASALCSPEHPYLQRKGIPPLADVRQDRNGLLIIPVRDASGNVQTLQRIARTEKSVSSLAAKSTAGILLSRGNRKNLSPFAKAMPPEPAFTLPVKARCMWRLRQTTFLP